MSVLHTFDGATVRRVIDPSGAVVGEHAHDWPIVSLYVMGSYRNVTERGEHEIAGPSVVFYRAGVAHRNVVGEVGFEQIEIEFDPAWLGLAEIPDDAILLRTGGAGGAIARTLAIACGSMISDRYLRSAVRHLLSTARRQRARSSSAWTRTIEAQLRVDPRRHIAELANQIGRSPSWIGTAYRQATGEGLQETAARFRVEHAARLLRESARGLADIAIDAGFCDQSHMNRVFRRVLGRAPTSVRRERENFRSDH